MTEFTHPTRVVGLPSIILPNPKITPGAPNSTVRQTTIKKTICKSGRTKTIRPPVSYTNALKIQQMVLYGETGSPSLYEEDHFIPLELGGAPRNPKNLWPEPHSQSKLSDPLETQLKRKVCKHVMTLKKARATISAVQEHAGLTAGSEGRAMRFQLNSAGAVLAAGAMVCGGASFAAAASAVPAPWKNCAQVNKRYPHGVGKVGARDKTSGTPVTTFKRSNFLYKTAMSHNKGLDRDKDGIACEKLYGAPPSMRHGIPLNVCDSWVTIDMGRACGLCGVSEALPDRSRSDCGKGRLRESSGRALSTPAPRCGQWTSFVPCRAGAQAGTLGVTPSVPRAKPFAPAHKEHRQSEERLNRNPSKD